MRAAGPVRSPLTTCSRAWASAPTIWPGPSRCSRSCSWYGGRSISRCCGPSAGSCRSWGSRRLAALAVPNWTPGPVVGAGGYVGAMGRSLLEMHFAQTGAYIFAVSVLLAGMLLSTDYFMFRAAVVTTSVTGRTLMQVGHLGHVASNKRPIRVKSDLEEEEFDEEGDESEEEYEEADGDDDEYEEVDEDGRVRRTKTNSAKSKSARPSASRMKRMLRRRAASRPLKRPRLDLV